MYVFIELIKNTPCFDFFTKNDFRIQFQLYKHSNNNFDLWLFYGQ